MVDTSLPYYGNVPSSKTIFRVTFFNFFIFECNFWYLTCSDLDEILHGSSAWCEVRSLIMRIFFKFCTSALYQSQVLFLSFNATCLFCQKMFGKCKFQGVKGQGVTVWSPTGGQNFKVVKIKFWLQIRIPHKKVAKESSLLFFNFSF